MAERKPWHQRNDESDQWYDRFRIYKDLPAQRRSIRSGYIATLEGDHRERFIGNKESTPGYWMDKSREYDWVERARAYDESLWELDEKQAIADRMAIRRRRRALLDKSVSRFEIRHKNVGKGPNTKIIQPLDEDGEIIPNAKPYWKTWYDGVDVDDKAYFELLFKLHNDIRAEYNDVQDKGMQRSPEKLDDVPAPIEDEAEAMTYEERTAHIKLLKQDAG